MKMVEIKTIHSIPPGLEFDATKYPETGIYFFISSGIDYLVMVDKVTSVTASLSSLAVGEILKTAKETSPEHQGGYISEDGLLRMMAILNNPENALELLK